MERKLGLIVIGCQVLLLAGCESTKYQEGQRDLSLPINCATAEGDIRMLQHEKAHVQDQILAGAKAIMPAAAVVGLVTGSEGANVSMAIGDYNTKIDEKIAAIKAACGLD
jgi:hypothetical protein